VGNYVNAAIAGFLSYPRCVTHAFHQMSREMLKLEAGQALMDTAQEEIGSSFFCQL